MHDTIQENPEYGGYIIPPPPPRPDFDASREKLRKLGDAEGMWWILVNISAISF